MIIGVPKEVKDHESRVGVSPRPASSAGRRRPQGAGRAQRRRALRLPDDEYQAAGAEIVGDAHDVWRLADMVVKVKEPVEKEYRHFREGLVLFTYLHLAPLRELTDALLDNKVTGIAYETVRDRAGTLPLLTPMSEVAGRMSVQVGAAYLEKEHGGRGVLLGGVPGVPPGNVCIIGGGIVGTNAAKIALGMGAKVTLIDLNLNRLRELDDIFGGGSTRWPRTATTSSARCMRGRPRHRRRADPRRGRAQARHQGMVAKMKKGAVIVDVAIDQGGCIETAPHHALRPFSYWSTASCTTASPTCPPRCPTPRRWR
jgi:alanine dehydrogenase